MISKKKSKGFVTRAQAYSINALRVVHVSTPLYNLLLIIEAFQLFSYVYNCLNKYTDSSYSAINTFSSVSTNFRVLYLNLQ